MTSATHLYDSRREAFYQRPLLRGWLHTLCFLAAVVLGIILIVEMAGRPGAARIASVTVYAVTVVTLFGTSALYHRGRWTPAQSRMMQRLDHLMIFTLIAGTATPGFAVAVGGVTGVVGVSIMWTLTALAAVTHLLWMHAPEALVGGTFIGLGVSAGAMIPALWMNAGVASAVLMMAGGVLYILGAVCYNARWPDPAPTVFGYHEVFHTFVAMAAAAHYVAITLVVL